MPTNPIFYFHKFSFSGQRHHSSCLLNNASVRQTQNCDDHPSFNSSLQSSHIWFSHIHNFTKCRLFSQATTISFTMFQATSSGRNVAFVFYKNTFSRSMRMKKVNWPSLRSRRLEVVGARKKGRARRRHPSRASVLSFAHYFQAPATQAMIDPDNQVIILKSSLLHIQHQVALQVRWGSHQLKSLSKL